MAIEHLSEEWIKQKLKADDEEARRIFNELNVKLYTTKDAWKYSPSNPSDSHLDLEIVPAAWYHILRGQLAGGSGTRGPEIDELHKRIDQLEYEVQARFVEGIKAGMRAPSVDVSRGTHEKCIQRKRAFVPLLFGDLRKEESDAWKSVWQPEWQERDSYDAIAGLINGLGLVLVSPEEVKGKIKDEKLPELYEWFGISNLYGKIPDIVGLRPELDEDMEVDDKPAESKSILKRLIGIGFEVKTRDANLVGKITRGAKRRRQSENEATDETDEKELGRSDTVAQEPVVRTQCLFGDWKELDEEVSATLPNPFEFQASDGKVKASCARYKSAWMQAENQAVLLLFSECDLPPTVIMGAFEPGERCLVFWISLLPSESGNSQESSSSSASVRPDLVPTITCAPIDFECIPALLEMLVAKNYDIFEEFRPHNWTHIAMSCPKKLFL